ncbi:VOC family protein [Flagellimonas sp. CMM7]|uniref:VOC family protein n=1 Tax=Flagellimonas sp. CMM7 TaxID=2654676 RepID=UPI0013D2C755|nr:VOC family protein [Flagellimonas sp. CMM7]UII79106.1 VOC family protein [Flagellimonas sp. CMM7]
MKNIFLVSLLLVASAAQSQNQTEFDKSFVSIGVIVSDLDAALDFYTNVIGMKETGGFNVNEEFALKTGLTGGIPFDVKVLKLRDDPNATEYKLMSFGNKKNTSETHIQERNGMRYITLFYKSTDDVLNRLKANNIKLLGETPITLANGKSFILVQDPDGTFIELIGN